MRKFACRWHLGALEIFVVTQGNADLIEMRRFGSAKIDDRAILAYEKVIKLALPKVRCWSRLCKNVNQCKRNRGGKR